MKNIITHILIFALLVACSNQDNIPEKNKIDINEVSKRIECSEERPKMCTREYRPVCATKDNGTRCIQAPCDSTDEITYSNACVACSDQAVYSHVPGECK